MKATLEFNLPEDSEAFRRANKADDMAHVLFELQNHFYSVEDCESKKLFFELLLDNNINFEEIWT